MTPFSDSFTPTQKLALVSLPRCISYWMPRLERRLQSPPGFIAEHHAALDEKKEKPNT